MARKAKNKPEAQEVEVATPVVEAPATLSELNVSFGQEDLNKMRDKINDIIRHLAQ